jgi:glycosyltransferase involved in cell wall biosynthesis
MAADPTGFKQMNRRDCRQKLNLPLDKRLIGYCGALYRNRGIELIFQAYEQLRHCNQSIMLVLTGPKEKKIQLPQGAKWLGYLPDEQMPVVLNCMDVLLVANQLSTFGNFSYPVKLYEAMACQVPIVATATKPAKWILDNKKQFLARPNDPNDLTQKIINLLPLNRYYYGEQNTWEKSCDVFETALLEQN